MTKSSLPLAKTGAEVILAGRNADKGREAIQRIRQYVMKRGQHGAYNIGEHMTPEGRGYGRLHRLMVPTAHLSQ
jgi:hypothetical protein